jgi:hypothetical protein
LALDSYVLLKVALPLFLINQWENNRLILVVMVYLMLETVLYIPINFLHPICFRNRVLKDRCLLFFNYIEMVFAFAVLYSCDNYLNKPFTHWFDAIYFSTTTSSTIGFGDFYPVKTFGRFFS